MFRKLLAAASIFAVVALLARGLQASLAVILYLVFGGLLLAGVAGLLQRTRG